MEVLSQFAVTNGADNQPHGWNSERDGTHAQKRCAQPCQFVVHPGPPSGRRLFFCQTQAAAKVTSPPAAVLGAVSNLPLMLVLIDCCTDMHT
jgi:hypothetical protein